MEARLNQFIDEVEIGQKAKPMSSEELESTIRQLEWEQNQLDNRKRQLRPVIKKYEAYRRSLQRYNDKIRVRSSLAR